MESVASLAQQTSNKSQSVSESLQSLTAIAADLQTAATQFKVED
jgi:methyl-accepting chemotaxis protein